MRMRNSAKTRSGQPKLDRFFPFKSSDLYTSSPSLLLRMLASSRLLTLEDPLKVENHPASSQVVGGDEGEEDDEVSERASERASEMKLQRLAPLIKMLLITLQ